jgi:phage terminase large subunit-like protein
MPKESKAKKVRLGKTEARVHSPLLKGPSRAQELFDMVERLGMDELLPWQRWVLEDMMKVDKDNRYRRKTSLLLISRQNGKSFLGRVRVIWGMFYGDEKKHLIMSSNRATALMTFREIAYTIESTPELKAMTKAIRFANGGERIELLNGATLDIVSDTRDSARGRTADFLYVDEAREISMDGYKAAMPTTRARLNSQILITSNAGDAFSEVLNSLVERCRSNPPESLGFYEYSAPQYCKITDREAWAYANPSMGYTISEEAIEESIATSSIETTRTETLCQWIDSLQSPWPHGILEETSDSSLVMNPGGYTVFAFDKSPSSRNCSLVAGQILPDGRIGIGILQTWESQVSVDDLKVAADIKGWSDIFRPKVINFDKYATASIAERLSNSGCVTQDISGAQFYQACGDFLDGLVNLRVVHNGQANFIQQMNNCAAKNNDSAWRIVKRKSAGDISGAISAAMVVSTLMKPQQVAAIYSD